MTASLLRRSFAIAAATITTAIVLAGCASGGSAAPSASGPSLDTVTAGKLTIATGEPAFVPWVVNNDPASGEGFEAAVSYALADKLGYAKTDVVWVRSTFDSAIAPGPKDWDLNVQQFSVTDERKQAVDFSSPYYTTTQAIVTTKNSLAAPAASVADLKNVTLGVASGTTSFTVASEKVGTGKLSVFNSNDDAVLALQSGQIDGIVVDLPTAFYLANAVLDDGVVVGQFADTTGGDQLAFVLPKNSALTAPVTAALDSLRADGTLDRLATTWLNEAVDAPTLK